VTCGLLTANAEYATVAPSAVATARASAIDLGLGSPRAEKYKASPSRMPNGNEAAGAPEAVAIPAATVTTASTGSGQRRSTTIGRQASSGMSGTSSRPPF
jgi:hypothetical protein